VVALAHALLVIIYHVIDHIIARRQPYSKLGADYFPPRDPAVRARHLVRQLTHVGFAVQLQAQQTLAQR
jgi:hypothetical protein